jgi:hypothetical protein
VADPVLVLGMHRSGTALVARILERLGVFMGAELDPNHEAIVFLELNRFALEQCGARWDRPDGARDLLDHPELRRVIRGHFEHMVHSPLMRRYTGSRFRGGAASLAALGPWGWKDPRTVLLLPLWLDVFPGARLVHVRRHGVDVAASLRARHREVLGHIVALLEEDNLYDWKEPYRPLVDTVRAGTLEGGFGLWEHYLDAADEHLTGTDALELRYEALVADPVEGGRLLARHLDLATSDEDLAAVAGMADPGRSFAYRSDPELAAFAGEVADRLADRGFGRDA